MEPTDRTIAVGLGRVEGKLDAFLSMQADQGKRITAVEETVGNLSTEVTTLKATKAAGRDWFATALSVLGVFVAAAALFIGGNSNV